ncbi:flavin-containing monooxygenase [Mycolicibacterium sp.]|uniref:flavin-containing monooxygenase n=1 Tax=Mycolicibacterium sp. TaxID=2320850 RepID=UPI003D0E9CED
MGSSNKYCIIGAGPAGLVAARALKRSGIPYDVIERNVRVGGLWDITNPGTPLYESAHFISSKFRSAFYGYPMPAEFPDYPSHTQVLSYITDFAEHYGLVDDVEFGREVRVVTPTVSGGWDVELDGGERRHYAGVIVASGANWSPQVPSYPGQDEFGGDIRHVVTYRSADELAGRRVLIVGGGNSGVDIACDAAQRASRAWLSLRRGYRFVPKHILGVPTDVFLRGLPGSGELRRVTPDGVVLPEDLSQLYDALSGDLTRLGLQRPDHDAYESHPILNSQFLHHLTHGDIIAKRDVARFTRDGVTFVDGSRERVDTVLFATGYDWRTPFLPDSLIDRAGGRPQLYLNVFHRRLDSLYFLGFVEFADAAYQRFDEMAQLIAGDIADREAGIDRSEFIARKADHHPDLRGGMNYVSSPRHASYVHSPTYQSVIRQIIERHGWGWPDEHFYDTVVPAPLGVGAPR